MDLVEEPLFTSLIDLCTRKCFAAISSTLGSAIATQNTSGRTLSSASCDHVTCSQYPLLNLGSKLAIFLHLYTLTLFATKISFFRIMSEGGESLNSIGQTSQPEELDFGKEEAHENPLTYVGYRVFSKWTATDQNFFVVRKFGALAARTALSLQDTITEYEEKLDMIDRYTIRKTQDPPINNGTLRDEIIDERKNLVRVLIPRALRDYCESIPVLFSLRPLRANCRRLIPQ